MRLVVPFILAFHLREHRLIGSDVVERLFQAWEASHPQSSSSSREIPFVQMRGAFKWLAQTYTLKMSEDS